MWATSLLWLIGMLLGFLGSVMHLMSGHRPEGLSLQLALWSLLALPGLAAAWHLLGRRGEGRPITNVRQRAFLTLCVLSGLTYCLGVLFAAGAFDPESWRRVQGMYRGGDLVAIWLFGAPVPVGFHLLWHLWWGDLRTQPTHSLDEEPANPAATS